MKKQDLFPLRISHQLWGIEICRLFFIPLCEKSNHLTDYWPNGLTKDAVEFITQHCRCAYCQSSVPDTLTACACAFEKDDAYVMELTYRREISGALFKQVFDREGSRRKGRKRKSLILKSGGSFDQKMLIPMLAVQKCMCYFCAAALSNEDRALKFHADHYEPLSADGTHSLQNIVLTCARCNLLKGATHGDDFERKSKKLRTAEAGTRLGKMRRELIRWRTALLHRA